MDFQNNTESSLYPLLAPSRVANTGDQATAAYPWGGNKRKEGDPLCGAGT